MKALKHKTFEAYETNLSYIPRVLAVVLIMVSTLLTSDLSAGEAPAVFFLVRHAEKADAGADPELTPAGRQRAADLAGLLLDAGISAVHSTDYVRTRDTAAPLAQRLGLEVLSYDPRQLDAFATQLRTQGGRHLVVGHSNTTPDLAAKLGGEAGTEIDEPREYDRLYVVTISDGGSVSTTLLRFGQRFNP